MDSIKDLIDVWYGLSLLKQFILSLIPISIVGLVTRDRWWQQFKYAMMKFKLHLPLIGTIAQKSKAVDTPHDVRGALWTPNEETISQSFYRFYKDVDTDPDIYAKSEDYLKKVGEAGSSPMPVWMLALVVGLVFVEAIGFGFAIAPYAAVNVTASQVTILAIGASLLMAVISCGLAHFAGEENARNAQTRSIRYLWEGDTSANKPALNGAMRLSLSDTYADSHLPRQQYWQVMLNRTKTNDRVESTYKWHAVLVGVVVLFSVLVFYLRFEGLQANLNEVAQSAGIEQPGASAGSALFDLPAGAQATLDNGSRLSAEERMDSLKRAFYITFALLSIVYVAVQAIMYALTAKYTMVGEKSVEAWKNIKNHSSIDALLEARESTRQQIAADADHALQKLRGRLRGKAMQESQRLALESGECAKKSFIAFCVNKDAKHLQERDVGLRGKAIAAAEHNAAMASIAVKPAHGVQVPSTVSASAAGNSTVSAQVDASQAVDDQRDATLKRLSDTQNLVDFSDEDLADVLPDLRGEMAAAWLSVEDLQKVRRSQVLRRKRAEGKVA